MTALRWVSAPQDIATALQRGKWIIVPWERLGPDNDLPHWQGALHELCEATDIDLLFIDIRRRSLTVVINAALAVPAAEQIHASIAAVESSRSIGQSMLRSHPCSS